MDCTIYYNIKKHLDFGKGMTLNHLNWRINFAKLVNGGV